MKSKKTYNIGSIYYLKKDLFDSEIEFKVNEPVEIYSRIKKGKDTYVRFKNANGDIVHHFVSIKKLRKRAR